MSNESRAWFVARYGPGEVSTRLNEMSREGWQIFSVTPMFVASSYSGGLSQDIHYSIVAYKD